MTFLLVNFPRSNVAVLALILGAALVLSAITYQFSNVSTNQVLTLAANDIRSNSEIQAHDLSTILANKVSAINNNLVVISKSPAFKDSSEIETAQVILAGAQDAT